jgi:limonene 1,2-monooxygenase
VPMATASTISPSGMTLAGKYGMGALSIASTSSDGLDALATQWSFAEEAAAQHGQTVSRADWRVLIAWHLAETEEEARRQAADGMYRWHNEYNVWTLGRPGATHVDDKWELMDRLSGGGGSAGVGAAVVGTPDQLVQAVRDLQGLTGGFGVVMGFAHDWANVENTFRSWDLFARYVIPELQGTTVGLRDSQRFLHDHQAELMGGAGQAIMAKVAEHERAVEAMQITIERNAARAAAGEQREFRPGGA